MNDFGAFSDDVEEVIWFVKAQNVLAVPFDPEGVRDFRTVTISVFDEDDIERYRDPDAPGAQILCPAWIDIKKEDEGTFHSAIHGDDYFIDVIWPRIGTVESEFLEILSEQLEGVLPEIEIAEITSDMHTFMLHRAACGERPETFLEKLFTVYKAGGYPCGWAGSYPSGQLVVFSR